MLNKTSAIFDIFQIHQMNGRQLSIFSRIQEKIGSDSVSAAMIWYLANLTLRTFHIELKSSQYGWTIKNSVKYTMRRVSIACLTCYRLSHLNGFFLQYLIAIYDSSNANLERNDTISYQMSIEQKPRSFSSCVYKIRRRYRPTRIAV